MTDQETLTATLQAPRWAGLSAFIRDLCWQAEVELEIETETTWLREHVRIRVRGDRDTVHAVGLAIQKAGKDYNRRVLGK